MTTRAWALLCTLIIAPEAGLTAPASPHEAVGRKYAVSTQGQAATRAAQQMLDAGGNAIDAFAAASFAISVERPQSTGIGGGGFLLYREGRTGKVFALDFRERAPERASQDQFLDSKGQVIPKLSVFGILSVATPGLIAGVWEAHHKWGKLPWAQVVEPAIELADKGFAVYPHLAHALEARKEILAQTPATAEIYLKRDGSSLRPYCEGEVLIQKDLGATLRLIAAKGVPGFYQGSVRDAILSEMKRQGGLISAQDLDRYTVKWRKPVRGTFRGYEILSMPPPSSGGTHVIEILNLVERFPLKSWGPQSARALHEEAQAMRLAFMDRAKYMGDPDFADVPYQKLASKPYARTRAESPNTTHFSVITADGSVVSSTQSINGWMGSGIVVPKTGIVLNNTMDDFAAQVGAKNLFGAVGGKNNLIAPLKTPLSSMSPTIVLKDGKPALALGAPGGTQIITCVAQTLLNLLEYGLPLYESVANPRFHHQWQPDEILFEAPGPGDAVIQALQSKGHHPRVLSVGADQMNCRVMAVSKEGNELHAVSDPRDAGSAAAK